MMIRLDNTPFFQLLLLLINTGYEITATSKTLINPKYECKCLHMEKLRPYLSISFFCLLYSCKNDISHNYIIKACFIQKKSNFKAQDSTLPSP